MCSNHKFQSYDWAIRKNADNHNGRRSAKHAKRSSDRWMRHESKKFIAEEIEKAALDLDYMLGY